MKSNVLKSVRNYLREYCSCSSVHGIRYFGEKRTIFEKIWWFIVFTISLGACTLSIYMVYKKWDQSPVIVSFANRGTPIYKIPFPAVTVCPESKTVMTKFNYSDVFRRKFMEENVTDEETLHFDYMLQICETYGFSFTPSNISTLSEEFFNFLNDTKPAFQIQFCYLRGKKHPCEKIFKPIITSAGVCYTFNMLDRSEIFRENVVHYGEYHHFNRSSANWSTEFGYHDDAGLYPYPRRASLSGIKNGFRFELETHKNDLDYVCRDALQGYKVMIHNPTSIPAPSQEYFRIPLDQSIIAEVNPGMISTSPSVRSYDKDRRRCYFQNERYLQYFKIYNAANCDMECLANFTLDYCGCVAFYMPRNNETDICGSTNIECMKEAERFLQLKNLARNLKKPDVTKKLQAQIDCDCLPVCTAITYDSETSQTDWEWSKLYRALELHPPSNVHMSELTIYFKSDDFINSERNELYGPIDFLANFGGLLGLFTGFSVLSLMEIVYFATVRLLCNKKLYGHWAGEKL